MTGGLLTAREVARVIGVAPGRLAYWVRMGLVAPSARRGGRGLFCLADLVAVKAAFELTERGVAVQAVRRSLAALRAALPPAPAAGEAERADGLPALARLRIVSDGDHVAVVSDGVAFQPLSGQLLMDFAVASLAARVEQVLSPPAPAVERTAWQWFEEALLAEAAGQDAGAEAALRSALSLDPDLAAAHNNLGLLLHRRGHLGEAKEAWERALALDPGQPEARYNLGQLLAHTCGAEAAIATWTTVTALDPGFADAHYSLGMALLGASPGEAAASRARWHLLRYLELDGGGPFAEAARRRLLEPGSLGAR